MTTKTCPRCFLTDPADREACIQRPVLGCPEPVDLKDTGVVVIKCDVCPKLFAIPVGNIMQRKRLNEMGPCSQDKCAARVVLPKLAVPGKRTPPPPIAEAPSGKGK